MQTGISGLMREGVMWAMGTIALFFVFFYSDNIIAALISPASETNTVQRQATRPAPSPNRDEPGNSGGREVFLRADRYNQFYANVLINGREIRTLIDTGASHVSLRYEDARRLGIYLGTSDFNMVSQTANGSARIAPVMLNDIQIGDIRVYGVQGFVGEPGKKFVTLLGMSFLKKLEKTFY